VTYVEPPFPDPVTGLTEFSYINCAGVTVFSDVGDGELGPLSRNVCARIDSITLTGGDESATWAESTTGDCCTYFLSRISETPSPTNGCDAVLDTDCWVSNITGTPGQEIISSGSVVYTDANGLFPFVGLGNGYDYKIRITGSISCTSSEVASNGNVGGSLGLCSTCP
jgi:hypothetical protein